MAKQSRKFYSQIEPFVEQVSKPAPLDPEANPWFWNPGKPLVLEGPTWLQRMLDSVDPNLRVTKNSYNDNFQIWMRKKSICNQICCGWQLLFAVHPVDLGDGALIIARLYNASRAKWGDGVAYFDAVMREQARAKEAAEKQTKQDTLDEAMETFHHSQISVAMRGPSNGSKWSTYHS